MKIRYIKILLLSVLSLSLILAGLYFGLRRWILFKAVETVKEKIYTQYQAMLTVRNYSFKEFTGVVLEDVSLLSPQKDTLFSVKEIHAVPRLVSLLKGEKSFSELSLKNGFIRLQKDSNETNYGFLFKKPLTTKDSTAHKLNYQQKLSLFLNTVSTFLPARFLLTDILVQFIINKNEEKLIIKNIKKEGSDINGLMMLYNHPLTIKTFINKDLSEGDILITSNQSIRIPFIHQLVNGDIFFNRFKFSFKQNKTNELNFVGISEWDSLKLFHPKIADDTVKINSLAFLFDCSVLTNKIILDSSSYLKVNNLTAKLFSQYNKDSLRYFSTDIFLQKTPAKDFFKSLPEGLFNHVKSIEASGYLTYKLFFSIPLDKPDSVKLDSRLTGNDFKIKSYGTTNLQKLNSEFEYTAYEKGEPVKTFIVGASNKDFVPLGGISQSIQKAILTSEDGAFFWHKGFNEEAFTQSIAINFKEGKFKRGGSTISMQLVKNIFLTRKKTVSRKLEELLITWLIENQRISSKERMFEVYLNAIEFGPMVYGIGPACIFYFGKRPADVTLNEAIFLSSLLPHPKWFKYSFDKNGQLKPYIQEYFKFMGKVMFSRKLISENEFNDLKPHVDLYRDAKKMLDTQTNINPDSLETNYNEP